MNTTESEKQYWELIQSKNSHLPTIDHKKWIPCSFEGIQVGELVKCRTGGKDFLFTSDERFQTRVEGKDKILIKNHEELEGIVLEVKTIVKDGREKQILRILITYESEPYFIQVSNLSCYHTGLWVYKLISVF